MSQQLSSFFTKGKQQHVCITLQCLPCPLFALPCWLSLQASASLSSSMLLSCSTFDRLAPAQNPHSMHPGRASNSQAVRCEISRKGDKGVEGKNSGETAGFWLGVVSGWLIWPWHGTAAPVLSLSQSLSQYTWGHLHRNRRERCWLEVGHCCFSTCTCVCGLWEWKLNFPVWDKRRKCQWWPGWWYVTGSCEQQIAWKHFQGSNLPGINSFPSPMDCLSPAHQTSA